MKMLGNKLIGSYTLQALSLMTTEYYLVDVRKWVLSFVLPPITYNNPFQYNIPHKYLWNKLVINDRKGVLNKDLELNCCISLIKT